MGVLCFEEKEIVLKAKKKNQKKIECHADDKIRKKEINDKNDLNSDTLSTENNDQKSNPDNQVFDLCSFYIKNIFRKYYTEVWLLFTIFLPQKLRYSYRKFHERSLNFILYEE